MEKQFEQEVAAGVAVPAAVAAQEVSATGFAAAVESVAWQTEKDGLSVVCRKGNLTVVWDLDEHTYKVIRIDGGTGVGGIVEQGKTPHDPLDSFLEYVDSAWGGKQETKGEEQ